LIEAELTLVVGYISRQFPVHPINQSVNPAWAGDASLCCLFVHSSDVTLMEDCYHIHRTTWNFITWIISMVSQLFADITSVI